MMITHFTFLMGGKKVDFCSEHGSVLSLFGSIPLWPYIDFRAEQMPARFKQDFPVTFVVVWTGHKAEMPSFTGELMSACHSNYAATIAFNQLLASLI